jgi:hypothetical protein
MEKTKRIGKYPLAWIGTGTRPAVEQKQVNGKSIEFFNSPFRYTIML